ncbi:photosynthetic protein synthase II [Lutibacter profundi]|uniref:Photosynthetic protein synthase II n=1 Tax=Lutibacter profundi TaxID=1622118 RepID=A0A0X8G7J6_9FLAO|nr:SCO family protein [Lutibacter profundi]AMC11123.1 photosynthetic protein synthase II [Lutibacter profundi]
MNSSFFKKSIPVLVIMAFLSVVMIYLIYSLLTPEKKLPIYNPADVNPKLVDESMIHIRRNHKVANFKLINQNGDTITQEDYKDKIYVADFFFTRCQTICPIMTNNIGKLQEVFKNDNDIKFLSLSVTPEMDSIPILREYANRKGVIDAKWNITTGDKKHIYELARKSYFAVLDEGDGGVQDFIHTENFILVDKKKQIRGFYDGTDSKDMQRLIADIKILKNEFKD